MDDGVSSGPEPGERVRTLLLSGDNQLKAGRNDRALEAFEKAGKVATDPAVAPEVLRELVERRIASIRALTGHQGGP